MLHVQIAVPNHLKNDNHGFVYLVDAAGNKLQCNYNFYFTDAPEQPDRTQYCDFVFDVPREELSQYCLYGDFFTSGALITGDWQVTFPLQSSPSDKQ